MLIAHPCELISLFVVCSCFSWFCLRWSLEGPDSPRISSSRPCKKSPAQTQSCRSLSPSRALASSARVHQHLTTIKNHSLETPPPHPRGAQADCAPHERTVGGRNRASEILLITEVKSLSLFQYVALAGGSTPTVAEGWCNPLASVGAACALNCCRLQTCKAARNCSRSHGRLPCCRRACNPELPFPLTLLDASRSTRVPFLASRQPRAF